MVLSGARGVARVVVHGNRPLTQARYPSSRFFASIPLSDSPPHFEWPHAAGCFRSHGRASSLHKAALSLAMVLDLTCVGVVVPISLLFCLNRPLRRPTSISLRPPQHGKSQHARPAHQKSRLQRAPVEWVMMSRTTKPEGQVGSHRGASLVLVCSAPFCDLGE